MIHELTLFHGTFGEIEPRVSQGAPFTVFPLMHFGSLEVAISRVAFRYVDDGGALHEGLDGEMLHSLNGRQPLIYEVDFQLDSEKLFQCNDWGAPGALGTAKFVRDALVKSGAEQNLIAAADDVYDRVWRLRKEAPTGQWRAREYEFRALVGETYRSVGIETILYANQVEAEMGSISYCFLSAPKSALLRARHDIAVDYLQKVIDSISHKVPHRYCGG